MKHELLDAALSGASKGKKPAAKKAEHPKHGIKKMHIRPTEEGGYHIEHELQDGGESTHHVAPDLQGLHDHIEDHMGEGAEAPAPAGGPDAMLAAAGPTNA